MIIMVVENGHTFWQCDECGTTALEMSDFAYGHDCEAE